MTQGTRRRRRDTRRRFALAGEAHARRAARAPRRRSRRPNARGETLCEASVAKDTELANLQLALEHFDGEAEDGERRALESAALREKNARAGARSCRRNGTGRGGERALGGGDARARRRNASPRPPRRTRREGGGGGDARDRRSGRASSRRLHVGDVRGVGQAHRRQTAAHVLRERSVPGRVGAQRARMLTMSEAEKATMGLGPGGARGGGARDGGGGAARLVVGRSGLRVLWRKCRWRWRRRSRGKRRRPRWRISGWTFSCSRWMRRTRTRKEKGEKRDAERRKREGYLLSATQSTLVERKSGPVASDQNARARPIWLGEAPEAIVTRASAQARWPRWSTTCTMRRP